jgi:hypothetical protein
MIINSNEKSYTPGLTLTISLQAKYQRMLKKKVKSASLTINSDKEPSELIVIIKEFLKSEGLC